MSIHLEDEVAAQDYYDPFLLVAVRNLSSRVHDHYELDSLAEENKQTTLYKILYYIYIYIIVIKEDINAFYEIRNIPEMQILHQNSTQQTSFSIHLELAYICQAHRAI